MAILDGKREFTLNKEFTADLDSYTSGWVTFPINNIEPGQHELQLSASDTYNNIGTATIRFVVSESGGLVIEEIGNYPNPVKERTQFFVRHNRAGEDLKVELSVIKISGELVVTQNQDFTNAQSTLNIYEWFMDALPLSKGTYIYCVKIRSLEDGAENQRFQKFIKVY